MIGRRAVLGSAAALALPGLGGCDLQGPRYRYRYKLTLQVLADGVLHTGVNVVQVEWRLPAGPSEWRWPNAMAGAVVKGEANVVDLGGGRLLVALLTKRIPDPGETWEPGAARKGWGEASPEAVLAKAYGLTDIRSHPEDDRAGTSPFLEALTRQRGPREIGPSDLPTLVTFRNADDPMTVEQANPFSLHLPGFGFSTLRQASIDVTEDKVDPTGIYNRLPWLQGMRTHLSGERWTEDNSILSRLNRSDFLTA